MRLRSDGLRSPPFALALPIDMVEMPFMASAGVLGGPGVYGVLSFEEKASLGVRGVAVKEELVLGPAEADGGIGRAS